MKINRTFLLLHVLAQTLFVTAQAQNKETSSNFGVIKKLNQKAPSSSSETLAQNVRPPAPRPPTQTLPRSTTPSTTQPRSRTAPASSSYRPATTATPATSSKVSAAAPVANETPSIGSPQSPYAFHSYRLSYMQSDRVIALLKALGYATVEYSASRGESVYTGIFNALPAAKKYPLVVKLIDSAKTSLMQPALDGGRNASGSNQMGGTYLHSSTTGAPEQRMLIIYERDSPEQLNSLLNLLRNEIDVPASQIVIEALVVEITTDKAKEFGFEYNLEDKRVSTQLGSTGLTSEFNSNLNSGGVYTSTSYPAGLKFNANSRIVPLNFKAKLNASISDGSANVLSNPTILVLDGRQALIRIGTQVPVEQKTITSTGLERITYNYINTGIVLNIRPRISEDGSEVTMQTETIVSSFTPKADGSPPEIESKTIQSFVRVSDNTPFIIAGLIEKDNTQSTTGIPLISKIPVLGNLFKNKDNKSSDREVIIVLTPHVMDSSEKSFSYVIPKDSQNFDSFDNLLFRNAYRIRDDDLFDLSFATQSEFYNKILAELKQYKNDHPEIPDDYPLFSYLKDKVPGEEVIVRRMIWEIVHKSKYNQYIADDHILLFEENEEAKFGNKFKTHLLSVLFNQFTEGTGNSLVFNLADHKARSPGPFEHPRAIISMDQVTDSSNYVERMSLLNSQDGNRNTVLLCPTVSPPGVRGATALEVLKGVLVLKRILALNSSMPVTIEEFSVGRQIIFPTEQELKDKYHVIDYDTARFFYEIINYYPEFEKAFNRDTASIILELRGVKP